MRLFGMILTLLTVLALASNAYAHAHLDHAEPPVSGTVSSPPHEVTLYFTQSLEPSFSTVRVTGTGDDEVSQGQPQINGNTIHIGLKTLAPGTYTVHWHAVSVDTHTTEGTFVFTVSTP